MAVLFWNILKCISPLRTYRFTFKVISFYTKLHNFLKPADVSLSATSGKSCQTSCLILDYQITLR